MCDLLTRLSKELQELKLSQEHTTDGMIIELGPNLQDEAADPLVWFAKIRGPEGSPFAGGIFTLKIVIPDEYPKRVPRVEFVTPIFHPNVQNGKICMELLDEHSG